MWGPGGAVVTGWAPPGSRLKSTNDPEVGFYDPEGGPVYARTDGSFTLTTLRTAGEQVRIASYASNGARLAAASVVPGMQVTSAVWAEGGALVKGWAQPGSRMKSSDDPSAGFWDPEGGNVYANKDGSFTVTTLRSVNNEVRIDSFSSSHGGRLAAAAGVVPRMQVTSAVWAEGGVLVKGWAQPGSRLKSADDPGRGYFDPEGGPVSTGTDGSFTVKTLRVDADGHLHVASFSSSGETRLSAAEAVAPRPVMKITAMQRKGSTIRIWGTGPPGSRIALDLNLDRCDWWYFYAGAVDSDGKFDVTLNNQTSGGKGKDRWTIRLTFFGFNGATILGWVQGNPADFRGFFPPNPNDDGDVAEDGSGRVLTDLDAGNDGEAGAVTDERRDPARVTPIEKTRD